MSIKLSLQGVWQFRLDAEQQGLTSHYEFQDFDDTILLPSTVSLSRKGSPQLRCETGHLTDPYEMEGYSWYRREVTLPFETVSQLEGKQFELTLERTRISYVWVDGCFAGSFDSLAAPHCYDLTDYIKTLRPVITIMVSNTGYKVPGGHMTSPDTQTNWNGILGEISLTIRSGVRIASVYAECDFTKKELALSATVQFHGTSACPGRIHIMPVLCRLKDIYAEPDRNIPEDASLEELTETRELPEETCDYDVILRPGENIFDLSLNLSGSARLWDEENPYVYRLDMTAACQTGNPRTTGVNIDYGSQYSVCGDTVPCIVHRGLPAGMHTVPLGDGPEDTLSVYTGLRSFTADGTNFCINGRKTFLRGKHEGMIFPLTGCAPMSPAGWLRVMKTARDFGINHYRFHTCCPPEAAFIAADLLGIYLQPELPFWGTFNGPEDEGYNREAQEFLEAEGFRMLKQFSCHPSFCMMSMGNELWGNASAINDLLAKYKLFRPHILYTQGSNNFQWTPNIQPNDDFFSGVRFSPDRQLRGSYAMCDKPLGHVQTAPPDTRFSYDEAIRPAHKADSSGLSDDGTIEIQYGTGVKQVKLTEVQEELVPQIPVISHEIGQYETFPDFSELSKYTGVLQPENLKEFKRRLEEKGMLSQAGDFFRSSGSLAVACYKSELEAALRSSYLAGFQILDIQDFTGQGTALVGVLNAFMENKGLISARDWRKFCSAAVLQAEFDSYVLTAGQDFPFTVSLSYFCRDSLPDCRLLCRLADREGDVISSENRQISAVTENGRHILGDFCLKIPEGSAPAALELTVALENTGIENEYTLWVYPGISSASGCSDSADSTFPYFVSPPPESCPIAYSCQELPDMAEIAWACLLFLPDGENQSSIEGTYCTDFWCYPMFRSISLSMNKEVPVGTMGLLIQKEHEALRDFPCESYTTPQWYSVITASRSTILDGTELLPIVQTIDNFDRNHRLGLLYELYLKDLDMGLLVCTSDLLRLFREGRPEAAALYRSLISYLPQLAKSRTEKYALTYEDFTALLRDSQNRGQNRDQ